MAQGGGTLRPYESTITNSFPVEPTCTGTFSVGTPVCSHNSSRLFSCNVGISG